MHLRTCVHEAVCANASVCFFQASLCEQLAILSGSITQAERFPHWLLCVFALGYISAMHECVFVYLHFLASLLALEVNDQV